MNISKPFLPLLALLTATASAHHSTANFDRSREQTITGTVKYFGFTNPHSFVDLEVADVSGKGQAFKVFAPGRVLLVRYNWKPSDMKVGDTVTITGNPDRTDARFMYLLRVKFASGKEWIRGQQIPE